MEAFPNRLLAIVTIIYTYDERKKLYIKLLATFYLWIAWFPVS